MATEGDDPTVVDVRVLGALEVEVGGVALALPSKVERSVFVALALRPGRTVTVATLAADVWGDELPRSWRKNIHVRISRLRQRLGSQTGGSELLITADDGYRLAVDPDRVDAVRFERLLTEGSRLLADGAPHEAERVLGAAMTLWRGEPLSEIADTPVGQVETTRLTELRDVAIDERHEALLAVGGHHTLVAALEGGVAAHPLRERRWAQLMLALYRSGRQGEALRAYQRARAVLGHQLGIEPGAQLRRLEAAILRNDPALDLPASPTPGEMPSGQIVDAAPGGPPEVVASHLEWAERHREVVAFIGRAEDVERLHAVWRRCRDDEVVGVLAVRGDAGVGKTRLAAEVALQVAGEGGLVLHGRCEPDIPLSILRGSVRSFGLRPGDDASLGSSAVVDLGLEVYEAMKAEARRRPVLLVIDDAQWADPYTVMMVRFLCDRPMLDDSLPVLALVLLRDGSSWPAGLAEVLNEMQRHEVYRTLHVEPLGRADAEALLAERLGEEVDPDEVRPLLDDLGGIPEVVLAMAKHLLDTNQPPTLGGVDVVGVPDPTRVAIGRQLDELSDEVLRLLRAASVLGNRFALVDAAAAAGLDEEAVLDQLDHAIEARLVDPVAGDAASFTFVTGAVRRVLLDRLTAARRARIEARLSRAAGGAT